MLETVIAIAFGIVLVILLAYLILTLHDRILSKSNQNRDSEVLKSKGCIFKPDWDFYERHLGRPAPQELRELYADHDLIQSHLIDYADGVNINSFGQLDETNLLESSELMGFDVVAIGTNDYGDPIYLRPGAHEPNSVYITYHDGGDTELLEADVAVFVQRVRAASRQL